MTEGTPKSKATLYEDIDVALAAATVGDITAAELKGLVRDIVASFMAYDATSNITEDLLASTDTDASGASLIGTEGGGTVQDFKETVESDYMQKSEASALTAVSSMGISESYVILDAAGEFKTIEKSLVSANLSPVITTSSASYDLPLEAAGRTVITTSASAQTINIQTLATTAFSDGSATVIRQKGAGAATIQAASGVILNGADGGSAAISARYGAARLMLIGTDEWMVDGDIGTITDTDAPTISSSTPADNATDVSTGVTIVITFNEDIKFGTGNIVLRDNDGGWADLYTYDVATDTGTTAGKVNIVGNQLFIYPDAALANGIEHAVRIAATCIDDIAGNGFAGITDDTTISFTVVSASPSVATIVASDTLLIGPNSVPQTVSLPGGMQEDDKVTILLCCDASLAGEMPSGWTVDWDGTAGNPSAYMVSKIMGPSPDTTVDIGTHATRRQAGVVIVERNVNAALDGAVQERSGSLGEPNPGTYTQTNANARKWFAGFLDDDDVTMSVPAGVTLLQATNCGVFNGNGASIIVAYTSVGGAASDATNPDPFTGGDDSWQAISWATY